MGGCRECVEMTAGAPCSVGAYALCAAAPSGTALCSPSVPDINTAVNVWENTERSDVDPFGTYVWSRQLEGKLQRLTTYRNLSLGTVWQIDQKLQKEMKSARGPTLCC